MKIPALAIFRDSCCRRLTPRLAAFTATVFVFVIVLFVDRSEQAQIIRDERLHVIEQLSATRARLEAAINIPVSATRAMAMIYAAHSDFPVHEFATLAAQARMTSPSIIDIALFRNTTVSNVYPHKGNERLIGVDFSLVPTQWPTSRQMMITQQPYITGPFRLVERDGREAVVVRVPAYRIATDSGRQQFVGAVDMSFLFEGLLHEAGVTELGNELHIVIRGRDGKGSNGEVFYGSQEFFAMHPVMQRISLPGGEWEIAACPRTGWGKVSQTTYIIRLLGGLAIVLAASMAYILIRRLQMRAENEQLLKEGEEAYLKLHHRAFDVAANPYCDCQPKYELSGQV